LENSSILWPHRFLPPARPDAASPVGLSGVAEEISHAGLPGIPLFLLLVAGVFSERLPPRLPRFPPPFGPVPSLSGILNPPVVFRINRIIALDYSSAASVSVAGRIVHSATPAVSASRLRALRRLIRVPRSHCRAFNIACVKNHLNTHRIRHPVIETWHGSADNRLGPGIDDLSHHLYSVHVLCRYGLTERFFSIIQLDYVYCVSAIEPVRHALA